MAFSYFKNFFDIVTRIKSSIIKKPISIEARIPSFHLVIFFDPILL
jgi:hypothetical protein